MSNNIQQLLDFVHNKEVNNKLQQSAHRITACYNELFSGYQLSAQDILNDVVHVSNYSGIIEVKNINFYSMCEHHFVPFFGQVNVFYQPNEVITGLGKIVRLVKDVHARRLQIQELMTKEIAQDMMQVLACKGVFVEATARHLCVCSRGPNDDTALTTTTYGMGTLEHWILEKR